MEGTSNAETNVPTGFEWQPDNHDGLAHAPNHVLFVYPTAAIDEPADDYVAGWQ